ncbi:MAG: DUF2207 domain-containing protein [Anaerolineae bacterium]|nr:DUF2207 domain-containing protein [Anaerolineae bacterium]
MRKNTATLVIMIVIGLLFSSTVQAQTRSVYWQQWDVHIDNIDTVANRFDVAERYDIDFTGRFTFGSVVIPLNNIEAIRNVEVFEDGQALRESCSGSGGTYCVENTDEGLSITYYFVDPINNDRQQFEIRYQVTGALRVYEGGDQLYWIAVPSEHFGFPIGSSTVTVELPEGFAPREGIDPVETYGVPATVNVQGTTITATANEPITGNESFEIRVQYPHNPAAQAADWQGTFDQRQTYGPIVSLGVVAIALLIFVGGLMGVYSLWYTRGRDPKVGPVPTYLTEPPTDLPPAVVGTLLDERAEVCDVISTIVDLSRRGYMVMEETQKEGLFGIGSTSEFTFKRTDKPLDDLRQFEKSMIDSLFNGKLERTLDSLRNSFYAVIPRLQADLYDAVVEAGLFTTNPSTTRMMWTSLGVIILVIAFLLGFGLSVLMESISAALLCIPVALGIVGVVALIMAQAMPAKTRKGAEDTAKWRAFLEYLRNLEKYADVQEAAEQFDDYLPYAVAFQLERSWVRRFSEVATVPIPPWYFPNYGPYGRRYVAGSPYHRPNWGGSSASGGLPGELARADGGMSLGDLSDKMGGGLANISNGLNTMLASASSVVTSRPQPSSGSSGRWSSGGRSWSGGGSFRGGGSGGGSRGFG